MLEKRIKSLKMYSNFMIGLAVVLALLAAAFGFGACDASFMYEEADFSGIDSGILGGMLALSLLLEAILFVIVGLLGRRGAKNPEKITAYLVVTGIGIAVTLISLISGLVGGTPMESLLEQFASFLIAGGAFTMGWYVKKEL